MKIRLGSNAVPGEAEKAILDVFRSGQYSPGGTVREFERAWGRLHKAKHAIFVNSGTDALRVGFLALKEKFGWLDGDGVAVPALTFVATVNAVLQAGLKPFFVDVGMYDFLINAQNLKRRIEAGHTRLKAVVPVHLFGQSCGIEIYEMAARYKLKVLEDSCETVLNPLRGRVSCYSTYMAHHVTTGVGGFALTDDMELNLLIRSYANHGRNISYLPGYFVPALGKNLLQSRFRFERIGYSCRGTEFEAAMGLSQLAKLKEHAKDRRNVFISLLDALGKFDEFMTVGVSDNTCMMFPLVIKESCSVDKYDLCLHLEKCGIETRDMMPITNQPCYKDLVSEEDFPVARWVNEKGFYIPCNPAMTEKEVGHIKKAFESYLTR